MTIEVHNERMQAMTQSEAIECYRYCCEWCGVIADQPSEIMSYELSDGWSLRNCNGEESLEAEGIDPKRAALGVCDDDYTWAVVVEDCLNEIKPEVLEKWLWEAWSPAEA